MRLNEDNLQNSTASMGNHEIVLNIPKSALVGRKVYKFSTRESINMPYMHTSSITLS